MNILLNYWEKEGGALKYRRATNPRRMGRLIALLSFQKAELKVNYPELKEEYGEVPTNEGTYYTKKDLHRAFRAFTEKQ